MLNSERPWIYINKFMENFLNGKGCNAFWNKFKRVIGDGIEIVSDQNQKLLQPAINLMMGFTRKRELLVPEWADDANIWQPAQG